MVLINRDEVKGVFDDNKLLMTKDNLYRIIDFEPDKNVFRCEEIR